ncbi:hypothetical protein ACP4OV_007810 [Aristida adscensionis]
MNNGVRGLQALASGPGDARHNLFRTLGPTLLISMGYLDLGKWLVAVDAGSRFGYDLVLLVLLFNSSAILFQYLSTCISMATEKNLAEICSQEYNQAICVVLGLQAGLSLLTSELTMIAGLAMGFNLVFEYDDLITSICFATVMVNLLPYTLSHLDKRMAGMFNTFLAGFTLLCFVLGLLVSHPKTPVNMNVMFPKLSGENAYSLMALLGANIIVHNLYTHSSVVQIHRRSPVLTLGSLFHDHLFSILFIFTGIFLVNYVLLISAADESSNTMALNFQDAMELMHQIFTNPAAPVLLLVILLFSSHIISLTCIISSDAISENFFGVKLSLSAHHLLPKAVAMISNIYCANVAGSEGIYQLLIVCPVIQAMLIPSSVIPVFRVSSSRLLMGRYRISLYVEILAFLAFLLTLFTNIIFVAEILFGDSIWTNNLKGNTGSPIVLPYTAVVLISCASIAFALFLAVTPLKSASNGAEAQFSSVHSQREAVNTSHRKSSSPENFIHEVQRSFVDVVPRDSLEGHQKSDFEHTCSSDATTISDAGPQHLTAHRMTNPGSHHSPFINHEESNHEDDWTEPMPKACTATIVEHNTAENIKVKNATEKIVQVEADVCTHKYTEDSHDPVFEKPTGGEAPSSTSYCPTSPTLSRRYSADTSDVNGNLSRIPGLGRAARKQLAAVLDEFWGHLFDYHGKLTQEANTKKFDLLIGLELRAASSAARTDNLSIEASRIPMMRDTTRGSARANSLDSGDKVISNPDLAFGLNMDAMGAPTWYQGMRLSNRDIQSSGSTFLEQNAELHSNFNAPSRFGDQFYQPATIHGYQLSTYFEGINASRSANSSIPLDPRELSGSLVPKYRDSVLHVDKQNVIGSLGAGCSQSPAMNHLHSMVVERSYDDPSSMGGRGSIGSSSYSKKYRSLPDMSAVVAASRTANLKEAKLGRPAANMPHHSRLAVASEKSKYVNATGWSSSLLAFDNLTEHNIERETHYTQPSMNTNTRSLWVQQPFEHLFAASHAELDKIGVNTGPGSSTVTKDDFSCAKFEAELLQSFRFCITKLLKLEGSGWLFMQSSGCDENLIDQVCEAKRVSQEENSDDKEADCNCKQQKCGVDCVWQASLVLSFGVWCIHRVLGLSLMENRPELWGKYTYILNRLQGILEPAFLKPRKPLTVCACLKKASPVAKPITGTFTTAAVMLEVIKDVEQAVSGRKGRSGTAAGDVAFPKGKENLTSVLKRYKRRLSSKPLTGR